MAGTGLFGNLAAFYRDGGLEIITPAPGAASGADENAPDSPLADSDRRLAARSLIQPDGDVILFVSEEALENPELLKRHFEQALPRINAIARLRWLARMMGLAAWLAVAGGLIYGGYEGAFKGQIAAAALGLGFSGAALIARWWAMGWIRNKIQGR